MNFERRMSELFSSAERGMPAAEVDWETTLGTARRERVMRAVLAGAAAVLVVGGGAWAIQRQNADALQQAPDLAPVNSPDVDPTPDTSPSSAPEEGSDASVVRGRFLDWVKAISLGDTETA